MPPYRRGGLAGIAVNPLLRLWLLVLASVILLSGIFYMAENYAYIIGNFYVLLGIFFTIYFLYFFVHFLLDKKRGRSPDTKI